MLYIIGPADKLQQRVKRSITKTQLRNNNDKTEVENEWIFSQTGNGTNIKIIQLMSEESVDKSIGDIAAQGRKSTSSKVIAGSVCASLTILTILILLVIYYLKRSKCGESQESREDDQSFPEETIMTSCSKVKFTTFLPSFIHKSPNMDNCKINENDKDNSGKEYDKTPSKSAQIYYEMAVTNIGTPVLKIKSANLKSHSQKGSVRPKSGTEV